MAACFKVDRTREFINTHQPLVKTDFFYIREQFQTLVALGRLRGKGLATRDSCCSRWLKHAKKLVRSLFTALQTIFRIWGFRTKLLLELHQTLFPHRKKWSGHETI